MRDYAELILDLRRHHCDAKEDDTQEVCEECAYDVIVADKSKFNGITDVCTCGLMHRAADAIEELLAEVKHWELEAAANETDRNYLIDENRKLVNSLMNFRVAMWISVEDELPSRYETVLLNIQTCKDSYVTIGDYEPNELRFRDFADRNNQVYCGDIVTHWMPLPLPPKGVE